MNETDVLCLQEFSGEQYFIRAEEWLPSLREGKLKELVVTYLEKNIIDYTEPVNINDFSLHIELGFDEFINTDTIESDEILYYLLISDISVGPSMTIVHI